MDVAKNLYSLKSNLSLYVHCYLGHSKLQTKRQAYDFGKRLAAFILRCTPQPFPYTQEIKQPDTLPEIDIVDIVQSLNDDNPLWQAGEGGIVKPILPQHIQAVLNNKAAKITLYRKKCEKIWLVIVHDIFRGGTQCELSGNTSRFTYKTSFDRVLWLDVHAPSFLDLKKRA